MRACVICFIVGLTLAGPAPSTAASCSLETICVSTEQEDRELRFLARNLKPWPVTVSIRIAGEYLEPAGDHRTTLTLGPNEETAVETFAIVDAERYSFRYWYDWTVGELDPAHDKDYVYRLPYETGAAWPVLQGFDSHFSHHGLERYAVDFDMPEGTPIHAARGGVVARVVEEHDRGCAQPECGRFANFIVIVHDDGTTGEYFHLQRDGAVAEEGQRVERGQLIGYSGNTGHSSQPHLHFALYRADQDGRTQSLPVRFETGRGRVVSNPEQGEKYMAVG